MFWSGNYIQVREVKKLLQEKNVTLAQVLEADDILQECKADNKALMCYLTKPEVLAELITLTLEEPPKDVELSSQYRHSNMASEVLTSELSMLSNQLAMDVVQMNRICDFVNRDPPLNPLLASYFSKTMGMLLEQGPKQGWCLYQIVCLRVLDIFRGRRDFLPNLLRHMCTSAIMDTFKHFIRVDFPFNKIIVEWFEEHQFLDSLIQIICGTYDPPEIQPNPVVTHAEEAAQPGEEGKFDQMQAEPPEEPEKAQEEYAEKLDNQKDVEKQNQIDNKVANAPSSLDSANGNDEPEAEPGALERWNAERAQQERRQLIEAAEEAARREARRERLRAVAADNAAELLCVLVANAAGTSSDFETARSWNSSRRKAHAVVAGLRSEGAVRALLAGMFTAPGAHALVAGSRVLLALLHDPGPTQTSEEASPLSMGAGGAALPAVDTASVERAVAPHIPLLHHALLRDPPPLCVHLPQTTGHNAAETSSGGGGGGGGGGGSGSAERPSDGVADDQPAGQSSVGAAREAGRVGAARLGAAAVLAQLARSEVDDVPLALISLGTAGVLAQLALRFEHNNFLHAQLHALVRNALANPRHHRSYAAHFIEECNLLTQLMDVFEANEDKTTGRARAGYMGHVVLALRRFDELPAEALPPALAPALAARWAAFRAARLRPVLQRHDTPLSGFYPSDTMYEMENAGNAMAGGYDMAEGGPEADDMEGLESLEGLEGPAGPDRPGQDADPVVDMLVNLTMEYYEEAEKNNYNPEWEDWGSPFEPPGTDDSSPWDSEVATGAWAGGDPFQQMPTDAPAWLDGGMERMQLADDVNSELAQNLRAAMSSMAPDVVANIVNANLPPALPEEPAPAAPPAPPSPPATPSTPATLESPATPAAPATPAPLAMPAPLDDDAER